MTQTLEQLSEAAREARRAYQREWHAKHPGKAAEYQRKHWERVAQRAREEAAKGER